MSTMETIVSTLLGSVLGYVVLYYGAKAIFRAYFQVKREHMQQVLRELGPNVELN